jgi:hypothetical protein
MRLTIILSILLNQFISYGQKARVEGHWRRIDVAMESKDTRVQNGDFLLNLDSSFTMVGNDSIKISESGFYFGGTIRGRYIFSESILSLIIEDIEVPLRYKVLRLTTDELIFIHPAIKKTKAKFRRIKGSG